jgi:hypothetical protein
MFSARLQESVNLEGSVKPEHSRFWALTLKMTLRSFIIPVLNLLLGGLHPRLLRAANELFLLRRIGVVGRRC